MAELISFVKAVKGYFESGENGRKVDISEFKNLTKEDKVELRDLLIAEGYNVAEIGAAVQ